MLRLSGEAKAPLHVSHVTSSGLSATPTLLKMIADAKAHGQDVTAELYPYTAAMSGINSTWFAAGWQQTLAISYDKLQWPKTGEFLTEATFKKYQRENPGDEVIIHAIPQEAFVAALKDSNTMIISDGMVFPNLVAHPRSSGTSARVLGPLVREQKLLTPMGGGAAQDDTDAGAAARDAGAGDEEQRPVARRRGRRSRDLRSRNGRRQREVR